MADWQWQLEINEDDKRKSNLLALASGGGALVCVGIALATSPRFWIVLAFMLASICVMGRMATRQLRSLTATVDGPTLTLHDSRSTTTIDLQAADRVEVRQRSASTGVRWVVEASGDGAVTLHQLPGLEMSLGLSEESILPLRAGIEHYHQWYRGQDVQPTPSAADTATAVMAPMTADTAAAIAGAPVARGAQDDFHWQPPRVANADRNQKRVLVATLIAAGLIAAIAVQQNWGDTTGILLSVAVVPGLVMLIGLGCWYAYTPGKRFRLSTVAGELQVWKGDKMSKAVSLAGVTDIVVDVSHQRVNSSNTSTANPYLRVHRGAEQEQISLPGSLGVNLIAEERVALERALKHHVGLA